MNSVSGELKKFIIKKDNTLLPNNFTISKGKRYIWIIACHLNPENNIKGYTLHTNINHSDYYTADDSFTCYINEFFLPKRFKYSDYQLYNIRVRVKDVDGKEVNLNEIINIADGLDGAPAVDENDDLITPETMDPTIHKYKYKLRVEIGLETIDE
ncbi:hypothetical protein FACS189472_14560 [Alphaproteobacteria bacterium]|nr:hypothetical protein FACS189472_14560 [Alphaproteobacteria bacterium]